jgi:hypothetical protein
MWCPTWSTYRPWVCFEVKYVGGTILHPVGETGLRKIETIHFLYILTHSRSKTLETIHFLGLTTVFS